MPNYTPHLDRRQELSGGSFDAGANETSWDLAVPDGGIDALIIASGGSFGTVVPIKTLNTLTYPYKVIVTGDYSGLSAVVGVSFQAALTPTKPIRYRYDGSPDFTSRINVRTLDIRCHRSGPYMVQRAMTNRSSATRTFTSTAALQAQASENTQFHLNGNTHDANWIIYGDGPQRMVIASMEWLVDSNNRRDSQ
jgi:hypothetical protein